MQSRNISKTVSTMISNIAYIQNELMIDEFSHLKRLGKRNARPQCFHHNRCIFEHHQPI